MGDFNDVLVSQLGERPTDSFDRQSEKIGDVVSAHLKLNPICMATTPGVIRYEGSDSLQCRSFVEHRKLLSCFRQFIGQQV